MKISDQTREAIASIIRHPEAIEQLAVKTRQRIVEDPVEFLARLEQKLDIIAAIEAGKTELWLDEDQKRSWVRGHVILQRLTDTGLLDDCADLQELKDIRAEGPEFYHKHFAGKVIVGWRGVRGDRVPYLVEAFDEVVLYWNHLGHYFNARNPALRRK